MDIADTGPDLSDEQINSLVGEAEAPGTNQDEIFPMGDEPAAPTPAPTPAAAETFTINVGGKEVQGTKDQLIRWAQMGYDYPQKMQALKTQQSEFEKSWGKYKEIDEYAKQNPDWWTQVDQAWSKRGETTQLPSGVDPNSPLAQEFAALKQELGGLKQFKESFEQEKMTAKRQAEDQSLSQEIQSMRDQFKHLDWSSLDQRGYDLEMQVLAYAEENGIRKFDQAFKLLNHDKLLSLAQEQAKEGMVKEQQKKTKLGLLNQGGSAPSGQLKPASDTPRGKYPSAEEILQELGVG